MSNVTINNHGLRINQATKIQAVFRGFKTRRKIVNDVLQTKLDTWVNEAPGEREVRLSVKNRIQIINGQLIVEGNLDLNNTNISSLPQGLNIWGNLILSSSDIGSLPQGLHVSECLILGYCSRIIELHGNISVQKNLYLQGCANLTIIHGGITVGESLSLDDCTSLRELPVWVFELRRDQVVNAQNTGIPARLLEDYNNRQNADGYTGPRIEFSINDYRSTSDVNATQLPNLVDTITKTKANHPFWQFSTTKTEAGSLFNSFALFLTRLLNELPSGNNRQTDLDQLRQKLIPLFRKMEAEYDLKNQDIRQCDFINNHILSAAETAVGTCIDKVKVGYLFMQLFPKDDFKVDLNTISTIIKTVEDIASAQVIFDKSTNQFIHVAKTILDGEFSDQLKLQAKFLLRQTDDSSIELTADEMNQLEDTGELCMDKNTLTQYLAQSVMIQNQCEKKHIGDQVEDILNLAYKILSDDFHKINMSFASCCTLKNEIDIGGAQYESAAITYIQQILHEQQNQHNSAITIQNNAAIIIQKQIRGVLVRRNQSR